AGILDVARHVGEEGGLVADHVGLALEGPALARTDDGVAPSDLIEPGAQVGGSEHAQARGGRVEATVAPARLGGLGQGEEGHGPGLEVAVVAPGRAGVAFGPLGQALIAGPGQVALVGVAATGGRVPAPGSRSDPDRPSLLAVGAGAGGE